jgi:hypothetical protein
MNAVSVMLMPVDGCFIAWFKFEPERIYVDITTAPEFGRDETGCIVGAIAMDLDAFCRRDGRIRIDDRRLCNLRAPRHWECGAHSGSASGAISAGRDRLRISPGSRPRTSFGASPADLLRQLNRCWVEVRTFSAMRVVHPGG